MFASYYGYLRIFLVLMESGADLRAKSNDGKIIIISFDLEINSLLSYYKSLKLF